MATALLASHLDASPATDAWHAVYSQAERSGLELSDWVTACGDWIAGPEGLAKRGENSDGILLLRTPAAAESVRISYEARVERPGDMSLILGTKDATLHDALVVGVGAQDGTCHRVVYNGQMLARTEANPPAAGVWHTVTVTRAMGRLVLDVNARTVLDAEDPPDGPAGPYVALYAWHPAVFRNIRVERRADAALRLHLKGRARLHADRMSRAYPFSLFNLALTHRRDIEGRDALLAANNAPGQTIPGFSQVICRQPDRYIGWPTIVRMPDGELLVAFSGDREEHVCPYGKTQLVRSRDGGLTWTPPHTINDSPLDDRDAGLLLTPEGTLLVSWFTWAFPPADIAKKPPPLVEGWQNHLDTVTDADRERCHGYWIRRSIDGGRTWGDPIRTPTSTPHGPVVLRDGRLLYLGYGRDPDSGQRSLTTAESRDDGRSWTVLWRRLLTGEQEAFTEPHLIECDDGRLVAMLRYDGRLNDANGYLWQMDSEDGGHSWTVPHITPIWGLPPHLLRLRDGRILCSYGRRAPPFSERACWSHDEGRTWDTAHEMVLRPDAPDSDLGYPASVELACGDLVTVYYQVDQPGEKTSLAMTRWTPPPAAATRAAEQFARRVLPLEWHIEITPPMVLTSAEPAARQAQAPRFLRTTEGEPVVECPAAARTNSATGDGNAMLRFVTRDRGLSWVPLGQDVPCQTVTNTANRLSLANGMSVLCETNHGRITLRFASSAGAVQEWSRPLIVHEPCAYGSAAMAIAGTDDILVAYRNAAHRDADWRLRDAVCIRSIRIHAVPANSETP